MAGSRLARLMPPLGRSLVALRGRGFETAEAAAKRSLEGALEAFVGGFNRARKLHDDVALARDLRATFDAHHVGFAFEGAGGQRALLDVLVPWRRGCLSAFASGAGAAHDYIAAVGAGLILARVPGGSALVERFMGRLDPLLAWCVPDGFGFASSLTRPGVWIDGLEPAPGRFAPFARRLFDAGLGRSLWWIEGASPAAIRQAVERFSEARRPHLWFGVGLAAAYAGGATEVKLERLRSEAGSLAPELLAGVPFACRLRQKGGNPSPASELAAKVLLGTGADRAASIVQTLLEETLAETTSPEQVRTETFDRLRARLVELIRSNNSPVAPFGVHRLTQAV